MEIEHLILFMAWMIYYAIHSILALDTVKSSIGLKPKTYRLLYSLVSTILLGVVLLYGATIYSVLMIPPTSITMYAGLMIAATGIFIVKRAFRKYSFRAFLGLKKDEKKELATDGIQGKVRHPLYSGTILIFLGYFIFNPQLSNLITLVCLLIYLPIGIRLEEKKLIKEYGMAYEEYRKNVPSLIPRLFN